MGKQGMDTSPYFIDMNISIEGLSNLPPNMTPPELFVTVAVNSIILVGKAKNGLRIDEHKKLYRIRTELMNQIKTEEAHRAKLEYDDFKFLMKCWNEHTPDPTANELVIRVSDRLQAAITAHNVSAGGEEKSDESGKGN
jgi:hypothetical protein